MNDRYSKLTRDVSVPNITALHVAVLVLESWLIPKGISSTIMTHNSLQLFQKCFAALRAAVGMKTTTFTKYHPQANDQVESFIVTLRARLRHCINEHQTSWNTYVQPLAYSYNTHVHFTISTSSLSLMLSQEPPEALVYKSKRISEKYSTM